MNDKKSTKPARLGPLVLPCTPIFNRLLRFAHEKPPLLAVRDVGTGVEATYLQLLTDVLALRSRLEETLGAEVLAKIDSGDEVYIAVLAAGGYEYAVAMLAVLASGAAAVPMSENLAGHGHKLL